MRELLPDGPTMDVAHIGTGPTPARSRTEVELNWDELTEVTDEVDEDIKYLDDEYGIITIIGEVNYGLRYW